MGTKKDLNKKIWPLYPQDDEAQEEKRRAALEERIRREILLKYHRIDPETGRLFGEPPDYREARETFIKNPDDPKARRELFEARTRYFNKGNK